jgi:YD repeat-containing protein
MENAQIYSYTYKPSVGLTSVTDPMKVTSRYEYDHFARLKNTLDVNKDIRQKNVYHYMDPSSNYINVYNPSNAIVNFDEDADYEYAYINSNVTWQTQSPANWITLNKTSGSSTSIRITVDENDSYMSRSEQIILQGYLVDAVINVIQVGKPYPSIIPEETEINFGPTAENQTISVEATNTNWTVNIEQDGNWLSVSPTQGGENTDLTFSCDQWSYYGTRYADVTLQGANAVAHISVSQDGVLSPYIMCADYVDFESQCTNEEFTLNINSNETWSYALSGTNSWFSVTTSGNSGESTMTITCEHDNVHSTPRVGYITLTSSNCLHLITVTQAADTN